MPKCQKNFIIYNQKNGGNSGEKNEVENKASSQFKVIGKWRPEEKREGEGERERES